MDELTAKREGLQHEAAIMLETPLTITMTQTDLEELIQRVIGRTLQEFPTRSEFKALSERLDTFLPPTEIREMLDNRAENLRTEFSRQLADDRAETRKLVGGLAESLDNQTRGMIHSMGQQATSFQQASKELGSLGAKFDSYVELRANSRKELIEDIDKNFQEVRAAIGSLKTIATTHKRVLFGDVDTPDAPPSLFMQAKESRAAIERLEAGQEKLLAQYGDTQLLVEYVKHDQQARKRRNDALWWVVKFVSSPRGLSILLSAVAGSVGIISTIIEVIKAIGHP